MNELLGQPNTLSSQGTVLDMRSSLLRRHSALKDTEENAPYEIRQ